MTTSMLIPHWCDGVNGCIKRITSDTPYLLLGAAWYEQRAHNPEPIQPEHYVNFGAIELLYLAKLDIGEARLYEALGQLVKEGRFSVGKDVNDRRRYVYKLTETGMLCFPCWQRLMLERMSR